MSSFAELVETFYSHWDSRRRDEWIPHVKHARDLFSKETQNKDQVDAAIVQGLTDDISSTVDEASRPNEYDCGSTYEDQEVLVEEVEEQKDRVISPFQHTATPYDISNLWEHNDENSKDDGYWAFMGPSFYDSSRPGSIVSIRCNEKEHFDEVA